MTNFNQSEKSNKTKATKKGKSLHLYVQAFSQILMNPLWIYTLHRIQ